MSQLTLLSVLIVPFLSVGSAFAATDACESQEAQIAAAIVNKSSVINHECVSLGKSADGEAVLALISLNNPEQGAETYLAVVNFVASVADGKKSGGNEFKQLVLSKLIGAEAFPIRQNGALKFMPILKPLAKNSIEIATNTLADGMNTNLEVWNLDVKKLQFKSKLSKRFPASQIPVAELSDKKIWLFK